MAPSRTYFILDLNSRRTLLKAVSLIKRKRRNGKTQIERELKESFARTRFVFRIRYVQYNFGNEYRSIDENSTVRKNSWTLMNGTQEPVFIVRSHI